MAKSKFFRVFVEGFTASDGRKIEAKWIDEIAETFNAATFMPRINCEHIKGFSPEPPFNAYGSVTAVKAQTDEIVIDGQTRRVRALYVQIDPNEQLLAINKKGQKLFTSVEISPDYAGTGKVGLIGLAVTDNPASLGTEALSFSAFKPMFDSRKTHPDNMFSAAVEASIELEADAIEPGSIAEQIKAGFASVAALFNRSDEKPNEPEPKPAGQQAPANDNSFDVQAFASAIGDQVAAAVKPANDAIAAINTRFDALETKLAKTEQPGSFTRSPASGSSGAALTDC